MDSSSSLDDFAISIVDLGKSFNGFRVIDDIGLNIRRSEIFGLLGPNGAGKTTTMRIISCLLRPTDGNVFVNGLSVRDDSKTVQIRKHIGLLTESPNIYERLTAEQNLRFFARAYDVPEEVIEKRIDEVLSSFDLIPRRRDKAGTFSKGMKQKLAIARALMHKPSVLLLDEPTSALDAESAKSIRELILKTAREIGHTVLLSTHNLDDASRLCDRIAILSNGRILAQGSEEEIAAEIRRSNAIHGLGQEPSRVRIELMSAGAISSDNLRRMIPETIDIKLAKVNGSAHSVFEFSFDPSYSGKDIDLLTARSVDMLVRMGGKIVNVIQIRATLEDIYLNLVKMSRDTQKASLASDGAK